MSWNLSLNGHTDGPVEAEEEKVRAFALDVVRLAKEAEVGITYAAISGTGSAPQPVVFRKSDGIDLTQEEGSEES